MMPAEDRRLNPSPLTQAQLDWVTEQTQRAAEKAATQAAVDAAHYTVRRAARGYILLVIVLVLVSGLYTRHAANTEREGRRQAVALTTNAATGSCNRVNLLRAQSNLSDTVIFKILSESGRRERRLGQTDERATRPAHRKSAEVLTGEARKVTITDLTNCKKAVQDPLGYDPPQASPLGDASTGELSETVKRVVRRSERLLRANADAVAGG